MKKIILIGATLLIATSSLVYANSVSSKDCDSCPQGVCCKSHACALCDNPDECKQK